MVKQPLFNFNSFERSNDRITPMAGLILVDGFMKAMNIDSIVTQYMPIPGSNRGYPAWPYIETLCLLMSGGGKNIADTREIREDATLHEAAGIEVIPSESAIGDWLSRMGKNEGIPGMKSVNASFSGKLIKEDSHEEYTLWADPTIIDLNDKSYGEMTYTGIKGDRPILVGLKELPVFIHYEYRKGNAMGGTMDALKKGFDAVESAGKKIGHVAADSEFYSADNINYLSGKSTFTIVADKDVAVMKTIRSIPDTAWNPYYTIDGIKTDREIAMTVHAMENTGAFGLAVMRWKKGQMTLFDQREYFYHAIATNLAVDPEKVILKHQESIPEPCTAVWKYNERAQMENLIKELKYGIGMNHMPCGEFEANAMYFGIGILTYNLMIAKKYLVIKEGMEKNAMETLRWNLMQIPAWIVSHANRVTLKLATTIDKFNHYVRMIERIQAIAASTG